MRFLCLAGARVNAEVEKVSVTLNISSLTLFQVFRTTILPVVDDLESDGTASFHFIHGAVEVPVPVGQEEFHGPPPHRRFLDSVYYGTSDEEAFNRHLEKETWSSTPEQKYRDLTKLLQPKSSGRVQSVLNRLNEVMREEGPFDGIIGDSEGGVIAATFIIDHFRQCAETNSEPQLRCAVFISGGPPYKPDGSGMFLADQCGQLINIPTCHIIGYNDCQIAGVLALYHLCDEGSASLVDHGRGHRLPRDSRLYQFMIQGVRDLIARTEKGPRHDVGPWAGTPEPFVADVLSAAL